MTYTVVNGEVSVNKVAITYLSTGSIFFVGDLERVALASAFETPPEETIVGATPPLIE